MSHSSTASTNNCCSERMLDEDNSDGGYVNNNVHPKHGTCPSLLHEEEENQDSTELIGDDEAPSTSTRGETELRAYNIPVDDLIENIEPPSHHHHHLQDYSEQQNQHQHQHQQLGGLEVRRVVMDRYDDETRSFEPRPTTVLTIRKTNNRKIKSLMLFVATICPFIMMDEWMLLPVGILLYSVALQCAWENWYDEMEFNTRLHLRQQLDVKEWLIEQRRRHRSLQQAVQRAKFEIHVLQNRPNVPILPRRQKKKWEWKI
mmetsp:Transcript_31284/g.75668  ORF Transcript_31284/g.75668 Transcript_31284/m.75668 type:complete len:259 (-) Transcript_31284:1420-2196(-)